MVEVYFGSYRNVRIRAVLEKDRDQVFMEREFERNLESHMECRAGFSATSPVIGFENCVWLSTNVNIVIKSKE